MSNNPLVFELGKYYKHSSGTVMHIIGEVESTLYGKTLVGETTTDGDFRPVGRDTDNTIGWKETTKEEWDSHFS